MERKTLLQIAIPIAAACAFVGGALVLQPIWTTWTARAQQNQLQLVGFTCEQRGEWKRSEVTVKNITTTTIRGAKLFGRFTDRGGDVMDNTWLSPLEIPPGAFAEGSLMAKAPAGANCEIVRIQDLRGGQLL